MNDENSEKYRNTLCEVAKLVFYFLAIFAAASYTEACIKNCSIETIRCIPALPPPPTRRRVLKIAAHPLVALTAAPPPTRRRVLKKEIKTSKQGNKNMDHNGGASMPYKRINVDEYIEEMRTSNPEFRQEWDNSMGEYQQQPVSVSDKTESGQD